MSPPANYQNSDYATPRKITDYSLIDDIDFQKTWKQLDILDPPAVNVDQEEECQDTTENYFDTGLSLDKVLKPRKALSAVEPDGQQCQTSTGKDHSDAVVPAQLPRYGFVEMLQRAFGRPDLLENNRYLNKEIAKQVSQRNKKQKRVSFAKVEVHDKHLPYCRRNSLKQEFGHLHAPGCCNYKAEQALGKQEFLIRGNFIRDNTKPTTEQDFYFDPNSRHPVETASVRHLEPLDSRLKGSQCPVLPLHLDTKSSTMDSITYHDKMSPGLRLPPPQSDFAAPKSNIRKMPCQPIFTDDEIISPPSSLECSAGNNETLPQEHTNNETPLKEPTNIITSPGIISESESETESKLPEPSIENLREPAILPKIAVTSWTSESADSPSCERLLKLPVDGLKLPDGSSDTRTGSFSSSIDSGYSGDNLDFAADFLSSLSDDSDSETEEDKVESETETVCDATLSSSLSTLSLSRSLSDSDIEEEPGDLAYFRDSGISSLSDNEEDIGTLIKSNSAKSLKPNKPRKLWFNSTPQVQSVVATKSAPSKPVSSEKLIEVQEGYVNPFSKRKSDSVRLKPPSVLGRLVCDTKVVITPARNNPALAPGRFLFDTPSPDDLIRLRQAGVVVS